MGRNNFKVIFMSIAASLLITGCSVTPQALTPESIKNSVEKDLETLSNVSKPIEKPISLQEAINRAINNNLKNKVQIMQSALANKQIDLVYYDMLPSLTASAGYLKRDNYAASASTSFTDGNPDPLGTDPSYSVSQDKERHNRDISFSWDILDFGLSYVRANQQADKYLIAKENERKVINNIKQEIRRSYYQAVAAEDLLKKIQPMMKEVKEAFSNSLKVKDNRVKSPIEELNYQRELLDILRSLQNLEKNLLNAKVELSELMGLKPGTRFELAEKVKDNYELPKIDMSLEEMEKIALENRPELNESRYKERISENETKTAILKMLPSLRLNAGASYDDNKYLLNNDWMSYGATISWNLLNIFKASTYKKVAETQVELSKQQKLAMSMAVLSQVHLSVVNFNLAKREHLLANKYFGVSKEIFKITEVGNKLNLNSKLFYIKEKLNFILSSLRHSISYANVQNSYGRIYSSLGIEEKQVIVEKDLPEVEKKVLKVKKEAVVPSINEEPKVEKVVKEETVEEKVSYKYYGIVRQDANIRKEADFKSNVEYVIRANQKIYILEELIVDKKYWYKTPYGYIAKYLLQRKTLSDGEKVEVVDLNK